MSHTSRRIVAHGWHGGQQPGGAGVGAACGLRRPSNTEKTAVVGRLPPTRYDTQRLRRTEMFVLAGREPSPEQLGSVSVSPTGAVSRGEMPIAVAIRVVEASSTEGGMVRSPVFFHQQCPVCGRVVRVRVSLLGRQVFCQHCQGSFVATDSSMGDLPPTTPVSPSAGTDDLIERANELLARAGGNATHAAMAPHEHATQASSGYR
jgi:hypothetical protein